MGLCSGRGPKNGERSAFFPLKYPFPLTETTLLQVSSPLPLVADVEPLSTPAAVTVLVLVAVALLVVDPLLTRSLVSNFPPAKLIRPGWPVAILAAAAVGRLGFGQTPRVGDLALAGLGWRGESPLPSARLPDSSRDQD